MRQAGVRAAQARRSGTAIRWSRITSFMNWKHRSASGSPSHMLQPGGQPLMRAPRLMHHLVGRSRRCSGSSRRLACWRVQPAPVAGHQRAPARPAADRAGARARASMDSSASATDPARVCGVSATGSHVVHTADRAPRLRGGVPVHRAGPADRELQPVAGTAGSAGGPRRRPRPSPAPARRGPAGTPPHHQRRHVGLVWNIHSLTGIVGGVSRSLHKRDLDQPTPEPDVVVDVDPRDTPDGTAPGYGSAPASRSASRIVSTISTGARW